MTRLLDRVPDLDAVFAGNDLMGMGALEALALAGRRVPDDVAVVGFDDVPEAARSVPALTTVQQPVTEMGVRMTRLLIARVLGNDVETPNVVLPTRLVIRQSG
jgi:DNA-binding LacI/PurR family transcriptional regulator